MLDASAGKMSENIKKENNKVMEMTCGPDNVFKIHILCVVQKSMHLIVNKRAQPPEGCTTNNVSSESLTDKVVLANRHEEHYNKILCILCDPDPFI